MVLIGWPLIWFSTNRQPIFPIYSLVFRFSLLLFLSYSISYSYISLKIKTWDWICINYISVFSSIIPSHSFIFSFLIFLMIDSFMRFIKEWTGGSSTFPSYLCHGELWKSTGSSEMNGWSLIVGICFYPSHT